VRILVLLLVRQRQAHERGRALVQRPAEEVQAGGLQHGCQGGEGLIVGLQEGIWGVLASSVQPRHLAPVAGAQVALLDLRR